MYALDILTGAARLKNDRSQNRHFTFESHHHHLLKQKKTECFMKEKVRVRESIAR